MHVGWFGFYLLLFSGIFVPSSLPNVFRFPPYHIDIGSSRRGRALNTGPIRKAAKNMSKHHGMSQFNLGLPTVIAKI